MKNNTTMIIKWIGILALILVINSCEEGYGDADYGLAYIYMPQATVTGGVDSTYIVPSGESKLTYNFTLEAGKLNIILGVRCSGKLPMKAFSVDVKSSEAATNKVIVSGRIENAMQLPAETYTMPDRVTVPDNSDNTIFYLSLDVNALKNNASFTGKNLVLAVKIENPDKYELSDKNTCTIVVIDVNAIREHL